MTGFLETYPPFVILSVVAIFVAGGITKGALGFGLPLITMSVLPMIIPAEAALAVNALTTPFNNYAQLKYARRAGEALSRFKWVVAATAAGVVVGAFIVSYVAENALLITLGAVVAVFAMLSVALPQVAISPARETPYGLLTGFAGGISGALTTANGPIYIMYLVGLKLERELFVSALGVFFIVTGLLICVSYYLLGMMNVAVVLLSVFTIIAANIGMRIGFALAGRIPAERFRVIVLLALAVLGVNLIFQGLAI